MYAIIDIETTGGKFNEERITEVAIYRFDGQHVTDQFITLINPEKEIQDFVVRITGINQKMLRNAPKFYEVAKRIIEITSDCILVAHNVDFDYRVLQNEFRQLGYHYQRETLCTVQLSRVLLPEKASYSLGKLVRSMGIPIGDRHRAYGDALATLELFKILLHKDLEKNIITQSVRHTSLFQIPEKYLRFLNHLPECAGIYYIHDKGGNIIYIGIDKNIRQAVSAHYMSHLKQDRFLQQIQHITFEEIENSLIRQLRFYQEIQKNNPKNNNKEKKNTIFSILLKKDKDNLNRFTIEKYNPKKRQLISFYSEEKAYSFLEKIQQEFDLQSLDVCNKKTYREHIKKVFSTYGLPSGSFLIVFKKKMKQNYFLFFENGKFKGYGNAFINFQLSKKETVKNIISPMTNAIRHRILIQQFLISHKNYKIIPIND